MKRNTNLNLYKVFLFCCLWLSFTSVMAQLPLKAMADIGTVIGPNAVVLADIDRDGDLDVVLAAGSDGSNGEISWWAFDKVNNSWGSKQVISASFLFAKDLLAVDIDRDGDLDVVAVSFQNDEIAWWENISADGSTWSSKKTIITSADGVISVVVADINDDGHPDILASLRNSDAIRWYQNDTTPGNGGWISHSVNMSLFNDAADLAVADMDRDGDLDVVAVASLGNELAWWENDGTPEDGVGGDGNSWTFNSISTNVSGARSLVLEDFDVDGDVDVAVSGISSISWFSNLSGDASSWSVIQAIVTLNGTRHMVAGDFDFDGDADILAAGQSDDQVIWIENKLNDSGGWVEFLVEASFDGARAVNFGDVDQDGDIDFVAASFNDNSIKWWENDPIHRSVLFTTDTVSTSLAEAAIAIDIDQDGDLDMVGGGVLRWFERQGDVWVTHVVDVFAGVTGGMIYSINVADLDKDGDVDIIGSNLFRVFWWENDGTPLDDIGGGLGTSWTRHLISEGHNRIEVTDLADFNRDGHLDILAFDINNDEVIWWQNDGSPVDGVGGDGNSWTELVIDNNVNAPRDAIARDIDRDGDMDIVVISQISTPTKRLSWWRNDADGTAWVNSVIGFPSSISADIEDVDRDGDLDVIVGIGGTPDDGRASLYEQLSPANGSQWSSASTLGSVESGQLFMREVSLGDFDLDGDSDMIAVGETDNMYHFENQSTVTSWFRSPISNNEFEFNSIRTMQANSFGADDIITTSPNASPGIRIFENQAAQAQMFVTSVAPTLFNNNAEIAIFTINAKSLGILSDSLAEISILRLLLEETVGVPLNDLQANSIISSIKFYKDINGDDIFDSFNDQLLDSLDTLSLLNGEVSFTLSDFSVGISHLVFITYFVVIETTPDALAQNLDSLRVSLLTTKSRMEDVTYDAPLSIQNPENVSALMINIDDIIFVDDFEG